MYAITLCFALTFLSPSLSLSLYIYPSISPTPSLLLSSNLLPHTVPSSPIRTVYFSDNDQFVSLVTATAVLTYSLLNLVLVHQQDLLAPSSVVPQLTISPAESVASLSTGTFRSPVAAEVLGALHVPLSLPHTFAAAMLNPKRSWQHTDASTLNADDSDPVALLRRREARVPPTSANLLVLIQQKPFPRPDTTLLWANATSHSSTSMPVVQSVQPRAPVPPTVSTSASSSSSTSLAIEASSRPGTARRPTRPGTGSGSSTPRRGSVDESSAADAAAEHTLTATSTAAHATSPHGSFSLRCLALPTLLLPRQGDDVTAPSSAPSSHLARRGSVDESGSPTNVAPSSSAQAIITVSAPAVSVCSVGSSASCIPTDVFQPMASLLSLNAMTLLSSEAAHAFVLGSTGGSLVASTTAAFIASAANPTGTCPLSASHHLPIVCAHASICWCCCWLLIFFLFFLLTRSVRHLLRDEFNIRRAALAPLTPLVFASSRRSLGICGTQWLCCTSGSFVQASTFVFSGRRWKHVCVSSGACRTFDLISCRGQRGTDIVFGFSFCFYLFIILISHLACYLEEEDAFRRRIHFWAKSTMRN